MSRVDPPAAAALEVTSRVLVRASPARVWQAAMDWERQGDWMLATRVRGGQGVGATVVARTGVRRIAITDPMVITEWCPPYRCVVRHAGRVVRGTGVFEVTALDPSPRGPLSEFAWTERLPLPRPASGRLGQWLAGRAARWIMDASLRRFARLTSPQEGRRPGVAHYHATIESRRGAAETFDYLATFSNAAEWDPGVLAGEQLDPGPVRVGTRFRLLVPFLGRRLPLTYEVTRYHPDREVALDAVNRLLHSADRIAVAAAGAGATVSYDADVRLRGPLRLFEPLLRRGFDTVGDRAAAGLARTLSVPPGEPGR